MIYTKGEEKVCVLDRHLWLAKMSMTCPEHMHECSVGLHPARFNAFSHARRFLVCWESGDKITAESYLSHRHGIRSMFLSLVTFDSSVCLSIMTPVFVCALVQESWTAVIVKYFSIFQ